MPDLLLEFFSEEIPARMQARAAEDLKKLVTDKLVAAGLVYEGAKAFATPRRLALAVAGIAAGAHGAIVEVHSCPDRALCDGPQAVLPNNFAKLMLQIREIAEIVGHRLTLWGREDAPTKRVPAGGWAT